MNEKVHEPVYLAAMDAAEGELRAIAETMNRLRARQEQIYAAAEALKLVVGSSEMADSRRSAAKPVYTMGNLNPQATKMAEVERVAATA